MDVRKLIALATAATVGCATSGAKLDTTRPIERTSSGLQQGGAQLDVADVQSKLGAMEGPGRHIRTAQGIGIVGGLMGAAGGALIGWPLGTALRNDPLDKPNWTLAYVGGGLVATSLVMSLLASNSYETAIDTYNASVAAPRSTPVAASDAFPFVAMLPARCSAGKTVVAGFALQF